MNSLFNDSPEEWKEFEKFALSVAELFPEYKNDIIKAYVLYQSGHEFGLAIHDKELPESAKVMLLDKFRSLFPDGKQI